MPEENLDHPDSVDRLRLNVLDVVDSDGRGTLRVGDDAVGHLAGRETGIVPHHADDGNIDVGENIDRSTQKDDRRQDDQHDRHDHKGVRTP